MRYHKCIGGEALHHPSPDMTATLISQETESFFTLTTEKGKEIGVWFKPWGGVAIQIKRNGCNELTMGRQYASLEDAIAGYKSPAIKSALSALLPA